MVSALITCAGKGERAGFGFNKLLKDLGGTTPFLKCVSAFYYHPEIDEIVITCNSSDEESFKKILSDSGISAKLVLGGKSRTDSVKKGLESVSGDIVLIHDGARPFVSDKIISDCINSVKKYGDGIACIPSTDTLAVLNGNEIISADRQNKYLVQTPQAFKTDKIKLAYSEIKDGDVFSDDSGVYLKYVGNCHLVLGDIKNKKLTYESDFALNENLRCGTGFDLHLLVENRKLILGGIEIPHDKGLLGHSDADVLTHSVMDALLSSASLGDIGRHFPDTDDKYKGISSMLLLNHVLGLLKEKGYKIVNVSAVVMAQKPKLKNYVDRIRHNLATAMGIPDENVGITCTTLEGIGTVGREEGIAVQSYCLTQKV